MVATSTAPLRLIGASAPMEELRRLVERAGRTLSTVLIQGETGVGKELVARSLHESGRTRDGPWVPVNCAALPPDLAESLLFGHEKGAFTGADESRPGKIREADGGTLFLDEVGELALPLQAKLLRVLQEREVDPLGGQPVPVELRVVAATHRDLEAEVAAGRFREDLLFRLRVLTLRVPPLRERREDVPPLVRHLLPRVAARLGVPTPHLRPEVGAFLATYGWPGNVRELENLLEETLVLLDGETLDVDALPRRFRKEAFLEDFTLPATAPESSRSAEPPPTIGAPPIPEGADLRSRLDAWEKHYVLDALARSGGRKKDAAEALGISPRAMSYYVRKHELG